MCSRLSPTSPRPHFRRKISYRLNCPVSFSPALHLSRLLVGIFAREEWLGSIFYSAVLALARFTRSGTSPFTANNPHHLIPPASRGSRCLLSGIPLRLDGVNCCRHQSLHSTDYSRLILVGLDQKASTGIVRESLLAAHRVDTETQATPPFNGLTSRGALQETYTTPSPLLSPTCPK